MLYTLKKIFNFSGSKKGVLKKSIIFSILNAIFDTLQLVALMIVLDCLIKGSITSKTGWNAFFIMIVSIIGRICTSYVSDFRATEAGYFMCAEKRIHIGDLLKYMPMGYFNSYSLGNITAKVTTTMSNVENNAPIVLVKMLSGYFHAIMVIIGIGFYDLRISAVLFIGMILFSLATKTLQNKASKDSNKKEMSKIKLIEDTMEYVQGMSVVKTFNLDLNSNKKIDKSIEENRRSNLALEESFIPYIILQQLILRITSVIMVFISIVFYINGTLEFSKCMLMTICSFMVFSRLETAGSMSSLLRGLEVSMDSVNQIDNTPKMDVEGKNIVPKNYDIEFKNVTFSYEKRKILDNINLKIPQKTTTAIVGPSGSGKSTLCNLIARFWDVNEGKVTIGGIDVKEYKLDSLFKNISMVFQKVYLFQDTIANNIKFGKPNATMDEIIKASKKACCHEFIMGLANGYDTVIGEGGATISGGEKQRISIARAILKDTPIIILDEATANVDPENEKQLQLAIEELTKNKTIIMIAHRLKTVKNADQIIVINDGKIVQKGTHKELINEPGIYASFIGIRKKSIGWKLA